MATEPYIEHLDMLPEDGRGRIQRYIEEGYGLSMSAFYRCVIAGDFENAREQADAENTAAIPAYEEYLAKYAPVACCGSYENLSAWRGLGSIA